jgi:hypothetical protein
MMTSLGTGTSTSDACCGPGAYRPFVSLAVAALQPQSVEGQARSRVVRRDPVQLLPRRPASLTSR